MASTACNPEPTPGTLRAGHPPAVHSVSGGEIKQGPPWLIQGSNGRGPAGRWGQGRGQGHPTKALVGTTPTIKTGALEADWGRPWRIVLEPEVGLGHYTSQQWQDKDDNLNNSSCYD